MKSAMKTTMAMGLAAALLAFAQARADESTSAASDDQASATATTGAAETGASADDVGAGGGEPARAGDAKDGASAAATDPNREAWLNSIWYGP